MVTHIKLPAGKQIFEGEIATYWLDDGILVSLSKSPKRTIANITENIALVKRITNNKKVPLLIYLSKSPIPDKETREFVTKQLTECLYCNGYGFKTGTCKVYCEFFIQIKTTANSNEKFYR